MKSTDNLVSSKLIKKNILNQYNLKNPKIALIKYKSGNKNRAVYKITDKNKSYCLKMIYYSEDELLFVYSVLNWLNKCNINVPNIIPTFYGKRYVKFSDNIFILSPWIDGVKCDFDNLDHLNMSVSELAKIHKYSSNFFPIKETDKKRGLENIYISTLKHYEQLLYYRDLATKSNDDFSKLLLDNFDKNFKLAEYSLRIASTVDMQNLSTSICHGDYVNKNIIFDLKNNIWIIDFDKCKYDYSCKDLSYFFRRLLKRNNTNWDLPLTINLINKYTKINELTNSDKRYILANLAFPQKFWKTCKDYFNNKVLEKGKTYISQLENSCNHINNHILFIEELIEMSKKATL